MGLNAGRDYMGTSVNVCPVGKRLGLDRLPSNAWQVAIGADQLAVCLSRAPVGLALPPVIEAVSWTRKRHRARVQEIRIELVSKVARCESGKPIHFCLEPEEEATELPADTPLAGASAGTDGPS